MSPQRTPLQLANLLILLVLALLLLAPLLGLGRPPLWLPAALLALRLGLQLWRARAEPLLRRPAAWLIDAALIALLLTQAKS